MISVIVEISKYVLLFLMVLFTILTYSALSAREEASRNARLRGQVAIIIIFDFAAFAVMFLQTFDPVYAKLFVELLLYVVLTEIFYSFLYKKASMALTNTMLMMISIGEIIISRLDPASGEKQLIIAGAATVISLFIPVIIRKAKGFKNWGFAFAIIGILLLGAVFALARISGGGKLSVEFFGITFQFSEFVKITFVFCVAALMHKAQTFKQVMLVTLIAVLHVAILVLSKDLGAAFIYFVAYIVMVCAATRKVRYAFLGIGGMAAAAVAAYKLFPHVRVRVNVWRDPFADYQGTGYQIIQAMFGVCAGGWFGTGLFNGSPESIPLVKVDFTYAAICEEMGILFAICLLLLCMGIYLIIINIALRLNNRFYKLIALGLGTEYAIQVFLTVGGTTNFIPMTGVTLPLISYGGSSIMCTIFMMAIIQGLYIIRKDEKADEDFLEHERAMERERMKQRGNGENGDSPARERTQGMDARTQAVKVTEQTIKIDTRIVNEVLNNNEGEIDDIDDGLSERIEKETEKSLNW